MDGGKRYFGQRVTYSCDEGYRGVGAMVRVCTEEQRWEPAAPECRPVACGQPLVQGENLAVKTTSLVFGGLATYACDIGFRLEGPHTRECSANGQWSGQDPSCEVIRCPDPLKVDHAYLIYADNRYGSGVEYYCDEGYKLIGPVQRLCTEQGLWAGAEPRCVPIRCDPPPPLPDGETILHQTGYRSVVEYLCHRGFELVGSAERTCLSDETWSGTDPTCVALRCPLTSGLQLENGRILGESDVVGSSVQYECEVGFRLVGPPLRTCGEDKQWSGEEPRCEWVTCPVPNAPEHGAATWRGRRFGDTVTFTCEEGYELSGDKTRSCLPDGNWSVQEVADVQCRPVECPAPLVPEHGRLTIHSTLFGGRIEFGCETGFRLKGPRRRTCRADRTWSDRDPECARIFCPDPPKLPNGHSITPQENLTVGVEVEFSCHKGFNVEYQIPRIVCNTQGKWTGLPPICRPVQCPKPPVLHFGFVDGKNYSFNSTIHIVCDIGWKLIGEKSLTCGADSLWSAPFPVCEGIQCQEPKHINNGFVSNLNVSNGATIQYECRKGYWLSGIAELTCRNDNLWSGEPPQCHPVICESPKTISNGRHDSQAPYEYGKSIAYKCAKGYELHGASSLTCEDNGKWSADFPVCEQISCPLPEPLPHGEVLVHSLSQGATGREVQVWPFADERGDITIDGKAMLDAARSDIFHLGDEVTYRCTKGFKRVGAPSRICQENGTWSHEVPKCKPVKCNAPENLMMGEMAISAYTFMAEVKYKCEIGYTLQGPATRKCQANATWSLGLPTCQPIVCPLAQSIPHGLAKWNSSRYGAVVAYECLSGYKIVGESVRLCGISGTWSGDEPHCIMRECDPPQPPHNGWVETEELTVGSSSLYHCNDGYELEGTVTRSCLVNESWSLIPPSCNIVSCLPPPDIEHGRIEGINFTFGSSVQYMCDYGYSLYGASSLRCLSKKVWSDMPPKCIPLPCPRPIPPAHGTVLFRELVVESTVHFNCSEGYEVIGRSNSTCQRDQTWNAEPPTCKIITCPPIKHIKHGKILGLNFTHGSILEFKCNPKFKMDGQDVITCTSNKKWSKPVPKCKRYLCDVPEAIVHSKTPIGPFVVDQTIEYSCDAGYAMKSNNSLYCNHDGHWIGKQPGCVPVDCGAPPHVENSKHQTEGGWTLNGKVTYICHHGHEMKGSATISCGISGHWSVPPICEVVNCVQPPPIEHGSVEVYNKPGISEAIYSCQKGFRLLGESTYTCLGNNAWNISSFCEQIVCVEPPSVPFGKIIAPSPAVAGTRGTYRCFPGYRAVGGISLECSWRGFWEGKTPHCVPVSCPSPERLENGEVDGDDFSFQSAVLYSCLKGFSLFGRDERFCLEDGTWSGETPLCRKITCGSVESPENGFVVKEVVSGEFGDRVQFACHKGFEMVGSDVIRCTETGQWDKPTPRCTGVTCSPPDSFPPHVVPLRVGKHVIGDILQLACEPGFRAYGDLTMTCTGNGTWSQSSGACKRMACGRPHTNSGAVILGMSYQYRDNLVLVCPPGTRPRGKKVLTCTESGRWDGAAECEGLCTRPCLNGGRCVAQGTCSCPPGFVGDLCQHAVCILPCLNGGTCVGPYKCHCTDGFTGARCQIPTGFRKNMIF